MEADEFENEIIKLLPIIRPFTEPGRGVALLDGKGLRSGF
jgi:hypothetical protein